MNDKKSQKPTEKGKIIDDKFRQFIDRQDSPRTRKTYTSFCKVILGYAQKTYEQDGQAMLDDSDNWSQFKVFEFKQWLEKEGYSPYYIESIIGCLRGFFRVHRKPLNIDRQDCRKLAKRHRLNEDYYFKKGDMALMYDCATATEREKYVVFVGVSLGLRAEDFSKITYGQLRQAMKDPEEPKFIGKINTEKEEVPAYPFLSHDAVQIVTNVLANHQDAKDTDLVYDCDSKHLSDVIRSLAQKSGVDVGDKRLVFHCCRKTLYNALNTRMGDRAKYIIGKAITEKAYLDQDVTELRQGYKEAELIFSANGHNLSKQTIEEVKVLKDQLAEAQKTIQELQDNKITKEDIEFLRSLRSNQVPQLASGQKIGHKTLRKMVEVTQ
jgi:hypothetical protein